MPRLPDEAIFAGFPLSWFDFGKVDVAISQAGVALAVPGVTALQGFVAPKAGSIVGLSVQADQNKTAGLLTFTPTINTSAITTPADLVALALADTTKAVYKLVDALQAGAMFVAGDILGVKHTSDANLLPAATLDIDVRLFVIFHNIQF